MATAIQGIVDRAAQTDPARSKGVANLRMLSQGRGGLQQGQDTRQLFQKQDPNYQPLDTAGAADPSQNPNAVPGLMSTPTGGRALVQTTPTTGLARVNPTGGGTMTRNGVTTSTGPGGADFTGWTDPDTNRAPVTTAVPPVQQKETANPLTGATNSVPAGASQPVPAPAVNPAKAMGYSARGDATPIGTDVQRAPTGFVAPVTPPNPAAAGPMGPNFSNAVSGQVYGHYVKNIFRGQSGQRGASSPRTSLQRSPAPLRTN